MISGQVSAQRGVGITLGSVLEKSQGGALVKEVGEAATEAEQEL